jgi:plastocyanin
MNRKQGAFFLIVLPALLLLVACGGASSAAEEAAPPQSAAINVVAYDLYFGEDPDNMGNPPEWTAPAGSIATLTFENKGAVEHDWAVIKLGEEVPVPFEMENDADLVLYDMGVVQPGEQKTVPFRVPDEPGTYTVICTVSGHYPVMQGRLIVS